jgi:glycosyltransferase involved in cell wall biosynthesis
MIEHPLISLIFPAYNEARRITDTLTEAKRYFEARGLSHEIIVSADGTDGTGEIVAAMAKTDPTIKVIGSAERRGKGYGIRRAVPLASGKIIGFADADNKTPIDEFDKIKSLLDTHDLVIGSRGLRESRIEHAQPLYRQLGSRGFGIFMHLVVGLSDIVDTQCGFKFMQRPVALDLFSRQKINGYMYDVEILYLARKAGYSIAQVPVRWRDDGDSRLQLVSGNIRNALDIFRIRFAPAHTGAQPSAASNPVMSGKM